MGGLANPIAATLRVAAESGSIRKISALNKFFKLSWEILGVARAPGSRSRPRRLAQRAAAARTGRRRRMGDAAADALATDGAPAYAAQSRATSTFSLAAATAA